MTQTELAAVVQAIAPVIREYVAKSVGDLRDRQLVLETKAATPPAPDPAIADLRERLAVLEVRPVTPGPPGDPGPPGKDGVDGKAGLTYLGVYQDGKRYDVGELVTWAGSMWHCNEPTETKPGEGSKAWTLSCKRGRDGKDGKDAELPLAVVKVR